MKILLSTFFVGVFTLLNAQPYVHQVFFLNEGYYNMETQEQVVPVSVGVYNPDQDIYSEVLEISGSRFGSDLALHNGLLYVCADNRLVRYNADTYELVDEVEITGLRDVAVTDDYVVVTRGELFPLNAYMQVYATANLDLIQEFTPATGPEYAAEDVLIHNNIAYVGVGNSFEWGNYQGKLGALDLNTLTYTETDLGEDALNPENLLISNDEVFAFCNNNYDFSTIARVPGTGSPEVYQVSSNAACGTSTKYSDLVAYQEYGLNQLALFSLESLVVIDTLPDVQNYYGLEEDPINGTLYATSTDFVSFGEAYILNGQGEVIHTFAVGVNAGNILMDVREVSSTAAVHQSDFVIYPNPASDFVEVRWQNATPANVLELLSAEGQFLDRLASRGEVVRIATGHLAPGVYLLRDSHSGAVSRFVVK